MGWIRSCHVQPHKVHSGSFCGTFYGIEPKKYERRHCLVLELVPLGDEKTLKPSAQNRIFIPLRDSFQNFWQPPTSILYTSTPPPPPAMGVTGLEVTIN